MIRFVHGVALATTVMLVSGCGGGDEPTLDAGKAEGAISRGIKEQLDVDLRIECPRGIPLREGRSFTCTGSAEGSEDVEIEARQTDDDGNIAWKADLMATSQIEEQVAASIRESRELIVTLDCPEAVVLEIGHDFDCDVSTPEGEEDIIRVTIEDEDGNVTWVVPDRDDSAASGNVGAGGEVNAAD